MFCSRYGRIKLYQLGLNYLSLLKILKQYIYLYEYHSESFI